MTVDDSGQAPTDLRAAASRGALWTVTQAWGTRLMSIAVFAVLGRQLEPSAFGVMALGIAIVEFGRLLVDQGLSRTVVQSKSIDDVHLDTAFWTAVAMGTVLTLVAVGLAGPLAAAFDEPQLAPVLRVLSLTFWLTALSVTQMAVLQREMRFRGLAARRLSATFVGGLAGIGLALSGAGVWALVAQYLVQGAVAVAVVWTVSPWRPGRRASRDRLRTMVSFGSVALGVELVGYLARRGDDLLIGAFLGPVALGFFNVAYRVLLIVTEVFTSTINAVAFPLFSRLQSDPDRLRVALHTAVRTSTAVAFPAFLGLSVLAPEVVRAMFGARWGPSAEVIRVLAVVGLAWSISYFNRSVHMGLGKPMRELAWVTFSVATKLVAFFVGYRWGIQGVAWAVVIHGLATTPIGLWFVNRTTPIQPLSYLSQLTRPLVAALVMVGAVAALKAALPPELGDVGVVAVCATAGGIVYLAVLLTIAPGTAREVLGHLRAARTAPRS